MEISVFLAKVLGAYLVIVGIFYLVNRNYNAMISDYQQHTAIQLLNGILALIFGLLIVFAHNKWEFNWTVIITVIGYLTVTKGIAILFFPNTFLRIAQKFTHVQVKISTGVMAIVIGGYLLYWGCVN
ncbi:MAG: hypothetical protein Tsb0021_15990 [Chlamydiales bacterium]